MLTQNVLLSNRLTCTNTSNGFPCIFLCNGEINSYRFTTSPQLNSKIWPFSKWPWVDITTTTIQLSANSLLSYGDVDVEPEITGKKQTAKKQTRNRIFAVQPEKRSVSAITFWFFPFQPHSHPLPDNFLIWFSACDFVISLWFPIPRDPWYSVILSDWNEGIIAGSTFFTQFFLHQIFLHQFFAFFTLICFQKIFF